MLHADRMGELGSTAAGRDGMRVIDRDVTTALPTHGAPTAEGGCDNGAVARRVRGWPSGR